MTIHKPQPSLIGGIFFRPGHKERGLAPPLIVPAGNQLDQANLAAQANPPEIQPGLAGGPGSAEHQRAERGEMSPTWQTGDGRLRFAGLGSARGDD